MKNKIYFILLFSVLAACAHKETYKHKDLSKYDSVLIRINKFLVKEDQERIQSYIKRKGWHMKQAKTGFWYEIYQHGNGAQAQPGDIATIEYRIELLDGTLCYTSDSLGPKTFKINYGDIESGVHQGIVLMHEGDRAHFIFPPYLAHGLLGDENKIPPRSIIVYDIYLKKIKKPQNNINYGQ